MASAAQGWDEEGVRAQFPALARRDHRGRALIYADAPGGTQVPTSVATAVSRYLLEHNANSGGRFITSLETMEVVHRARAAASAIVGGEPGNVVFGPNMTTLCFSFSRALARTWQAGDEVVVTRADHDANVAPWLHAARDRGAVVRVVGFDGDGRVTPDLLAPALSSRTRVVALGYASNATGTIADVRALAAFAHAQGAVVVVDAVHFAPHGLIDVDALGCDALLCSAYKFCGPHVGLLWARPELLERETPYKVRPATEASPGRWETGTLSFEALAGFEACVLYLCALAGERQISRAALVQAMARIVAHERELSRRLLGGLARLPAYTLYGITDVARVAERTPTIAIRHARLPPRALNEALAAQGILAWDGHFYAQGFVEQLGLQQGGVLRIGFAHYATLAEVDRVVDALAAIDAAS